MKQYLYDFNKFDIQIFYLSDLSWDRNLPAYLRVGIFLVPNEDIVYYELLLRNLQENVKKGLLYP